MANRLLTRDEWPAAFREQARVWQVQWRAMTEAAQAPSAYPQPSQYATSDASERALAEYAFARYCHHCWHAPSDWQQGTSPVPVPRLCCWCGVPEGPQHGPFAPQG